MHQLLDHILEINPIPHRKKYLIFYIAKLYSEHNYQLVYEKIEIEITNIVKCSFLFLWQQDRDIVTKVMKMSSTNNAISTVI